jgi:hypothetical protein
VYEAIGYVVADVGSEEGPTDPRCTDESDARLVAMIEEKLGAIGERRLARARAERIAAQPVTVRPGLLDKSVEWLRNRLRELQAMVPGDALVASHRDLSQVSHDDLRSMVADLEALVPGAASDDDES